MRRAAQILTLATLALAAFVPLAQASEFDQFEVASAGASLSNYQGGAHADFTTEFTLKTEFPGGDVAQTRDIKVELPPGLIGNPNAIPKCTMAQFLNAQCPLESQVGILEYVLRGSLGSNFAGLYNMPSPGGDMVARLGFVAGFGFPVTINVRLRPSDYGLTADVEGIPSAVPITASRTTVWGVPADPSHDFERLKPTEKTLLSVPRSSILPPAPFFYNPSNCGTPLKVKISADTYQIPGSFSGKEASMGPLVGCGALQLNPTASLRPTTSQGTTGSGLDYELKLPTKGLEVPNITYGPQLHSAEVTLPEGMSVNPSQAEGLGICTEADFNRETFDSPPGAGCPESSKIGSVSSTSPVIDRVAEGSLYVAKPYENPFGSLLALYMVLKVPDRGVIVRLSGKVDLDPRTGQLKTTFNDIPQLPAGDFKLHFREGARAPLVTPATCGTHAATSDFTGWSAPEEITHKSNSFQIESGPDRGPCPTGGLPPFRPGLVAGSINNAAGAFSPFNVRLTRNDAEQEITHFSIKLPPGMLGRLAGIPFCSDAQIAMATARKGIHGGDEELNHPSCPAASEIGHSLGGAGVGDVLVYVPGKIYLAGPYHGSALSIVAITAAKAGPFDLGTVVIREALSINPETAEVFVDATGSDPIPHIVQGVPVRLKDIRAYIDRPDFTLNPTDCTRTSTASTLLGAGLDFASEADDRPITVSTPFQVADCAALPFKPKISFKLKGGTRRGAHPAFTALLKGQGLGAAGIARSQVTLPKSEFIENAHFKTICTRVQFKAGKVPGESCPAGSIYGKASAVTPLLDEPLSGPVFLRSSEHQLPDLVVALHSGKIDVVLVGGVDSVDGQLRTTFESVPDAPVTSFHLQMQGGKKGLFVNSTNLCKGAHRAIVEFDGQNGKQLSSTPALKAKCPKARKKRGR